MQHILSKLASAAIAKGRSVMLRQATVLWWRVQQDLWVLSSRAHVHAYFSVKKVLGSEIIFVFYHVI